MPEDWDFAGLAAAVLKDFNTRIDPQGWLAQEPELESQALRERVVRAVHEAYDAKVARVGAPIMRHVEREMMLRKLDQHWREHLAAMDYLRQGIHLRGYAQKDYRFEFKREAFEMFAGMLDRIKYETSSLMATIDVRTQEEIEREEEERRQRLMRALQAQHAERGFGAAGHGRAAGGARRARRRRGRRAACGRTVAAGALRPLRAWRAQGRTQRAVSVRLGQEVQALPRCALERRVALRPAHPQRGSGRASTWWPRRSTTRAGRC